MAERQQRERVLEALVGIPVSDGNEVKILRNGDEIFPAMLEAVARAQRTIDLGTYIWQGGPIADEFASLIAERAQSGVRVRILLDGFGSRGVDERTLARMRAAGALVEIFRPLATWRVWSVNMRSHRRALVCDETIGFTGGAAIGQQWCGDARHPGEWRDTHFRVRGPAVDGIRAGFARDWVETTHPLFDDRDEFPVQPRAGNTRVQVVDAASELGWNDVVVALTALLSSARRRVRIATAYMRPTASFVTLLCHLARSGVSVEVLVPGPHVDRRLGQLGGETHYGRLLEAGVEIWRYQPTMLHTKIVTVDGQAALVGTANFDSRSFALNEQLSMVLFDPAVTRVLDEHFDEDLTRSERVRLHDWRERSALRRAQETVVAAATYALRGAGAPGTTSPGRELRRGGAKAGPAYTPPRGAVPAEQEPAEGLRSDGRPRP